MSARLFPLASLPLLTVIVGASHHRGAEPGQTPSRDRAVLMSGVRDPAWAPDGRRLAVIALDRLWTMARDGRDARMLTGDGDGIEREPAWSPDGQRVAFTADRGDGFDLYTVSPSGGRPVRVTSLPGDERSPSWSSTDRLVFSHRQSRGIQATTESSSDPSQWDLYSIRTGADGSWQTPVNLTNSPDSETGPVVSPDGRRVIFVSDRLNEDGDTDLWLMGIGEPGARHGTSVRAGSVRLTSAGGVAGGVSWATAGDRASYCARQGNVASTWVISVGAVDGRSAARERAVAERVLLSRHAGSTSWSPDGRSILIAELPGRELQPEYNGDPKRNETEAPALFGLGGAFRLWTVSAPRAVDEGGRFLATEIRLPDGLLSSAFDRVWQTLQALYYADGPSAAEWTALRAKYEEKARQASDEASLESVIDELVLEQPLIKAPVASSRAVVVSAHPLASEAGRLVLERGGNIVDAAIAVSFALGVVEPDASGLGGDGMAVLSLKGMNEPTVIDYKDQTPIHATIDNPRILRGGKLVADGAAAANIPGVVAGLDLLYRRYGSQKVSWSDLIAPAIRYAQEGYILDEGLPTTVVEGHKLFEKWPEARRIFLPSGKLPRSGDRFINADYATTLKGLAQDGADSFYRGSIARAIAADMEANGGIIGFDDLAQYRAIERQPISGRYRDHIVYASAPPVGSGVRLVETLQILQHFKPAAGARFVTDPDYFHYLIESWKVRDPVRRIADPDRWSVDVAAHLTDSHAAKFFEKIDRSKASALEAASDDEDESSDESAEESTRRPDRIGRGTTSFAVADADGNMIAVTQTLSTWGGSFYVSKGLGFLYNNHLRSSRTKGGVYGQLLPLMRSSSTSNPTLVFRDQDGVRIPRLAVGAAGNEWITSSVYSIIANVIDGGMPMQQAVEAPRFVVGRDPSDPEGLTARIDIEDRIPRQTLEDLMQRGHRFRKIGRKGEVRYGYASAVLVDIASSRVEGGADPRRSHQAASVPGPKSATAGR